MKNRLTSESDMPINGMAGEARNPSSPFGRNRAVQTSERLPIHILFTYAKGKRRFCRPGFMPIEPGSPPLRRAWRTSRRGYQAKTCGVAMLKYPQAEAFIAKTIQNTSDDCVLWPFGRYKTGYARIYRRRRSFLVSRIICEAKNGTPPTSKHECAHSCGNGNMGCIAPAHLRTVALNRIGFLA